MRLLVNLAPIMESSFTGSFEEYMMIIASMITSFLLSLIVVRTYKKSYQTTVYNKSFVVSLPITALITTIIIMAVSFNPILSLGMVGALSIVRFRTAIKNPFDTIFMYWTIGIGITCGAGLLLVGLIATLIIMIAIRLLLRMELIGEAYFLIIRSNRQNETEITSILESHKIKYNIKNKTITKARFDVTIEVKGNKEKTDYVAEINALDSVKDINIITHDGDYIAE